MSRCLTIIRNQILLAPLKTLHPVRTLNKPRVGMQPVVRVPVPTVTGKEANTMSLILWD
jgi:hypothetical protein